MAFLVVQQYERTAATALYPCGRRNSRLESLLHLLVMPRVLSLSALTNESSCFLVRWLRLVTNSERQWSDARKHRHRHGRLQNVGTQDFGNISSIITRERERERDKQRKGYYIFSVTHRQNNSKENWKNDSDRGKLKDSEGNLSECCFVHYKSHAE